MISEGIDKSICFSVALISGKDQGKKTSGSYFPASWFHESHNFGGSVPLFRVHYVPPHKP